MKKNILLFIISLCFTMCKQEPPQIDHVFFVDMDSPEKVSLFDYFRSIELITLETSSEALVSAISKTIIHQNNYYILDKPQSIIFVFDQNGKFLFKIDKKGQGPGEYSFIADFNINPFSNNIELLENYGRVHKYDLMGKYIETKQVEYPDFTVVHLFAIIDTHTHVFHAQFAPNMIVYFNLDETKLLHEEYEEDRDLSYYAIKNLYQYQGDWYFYRPVNPIVYKIGKDRLEVAFQFDFGSYTRKGLKANFSEESSRNRNKKMEEWFAQFPYALLTLRHNRQYILTSLLWKDPNQTANIIYDKFNGKSNFIIDFAEKIEFEPEVVTDEYVLSKCRWVDLEKYLSKEMLDDKQKEIFKELIQTKMEQNPILIKYYFK